MSPWLMAWGQEGDGLGAGSESDGNSDVAISTEIQQLAMGACVLIWNAFRKTGLEPVDASVITPEQMALSVDSSTCIILPTTYPVSSMVVQNHLYFERFYKISLAPIGRIWCRGTTIDHVDSFWHITVQNIPAPLSKNHHGETFSRWSSGSRHR